jgi:hypothetical protein
VRYLVSPSSHGRVGGPSLGEAVAEIAGKVAGLAEVRSRHLWSTGLVADREAAHIQTWKTNIPVVVLEDFGTFPSVLEYAVVAEGYCSGCCSNALVVDAQHVRSLRRTVHPP